MKRKILSLALALVMVLALASVATAAETVANDDFTLTNIILTQHEYLSGPVPPGGCYNAEYIVSEGAAITFNLPLWYWSSYKLIGIDDDWGDAIEEEGNFDQFLNYKSLELKAYTIYQICFAYNYDWGLFEYWVVVKVVDAETAAKISSTTTTAPNLDSAASWARDHIISALAKSFVPADIQGSYGEVITRAEFCRMAVEWAKYALGETDLDAIVAERGDPDRMGDTFSDTDDPNILAAYRLGITSGAGGGLFNPDGDFTREQAATMIMNTCRAIGADVSNPPTADFADLSVTVGWAQPGINFVRANGIMSGDGTNFNPTNVYTRQESIVTFNNIKPDELP
ncbi:MAG: S-layer homology domain-containing protein [Oscillospiraceae bacterium]|nr:S-layer homology domain-containing protein [Oscillospiraceae bacterium]